MGEKVFISYSRADGEFVLGLARDLRAASVDLWVDQLDIRTGETWDNAVEEALQECTGLLVVLSPDAVASRSVMDEVSYALEENKRVIPVIHRPCKLPFRLRRVQYSDLTTDYDRGLSGLIRVLSAPAAHDDHPREPEAPPLDRPDREAQAQGYASPPHPPQPREPSWRSRHPRLFTALRVGAVGAVASTTAVAIVLSDEAPPLDIVAVFGVMMGLAWAAAGAIAGPREFPLKCAVAGSILVFLGWLWIGARLLGQELNYVLNQAVVFVWPGGAILGAWIGAWRAGAAERKQRKRAAA